MGAIHVTTAIRNPADPDKVWEGLFLVDTGATDCMVPRQHLESIGLAPEGYRIYELADGSEVRMGVTVARVEFMGEFVGATVIFGEPHTEPILGVTALESVGIEIDPLNQTLKRLPAVRLKPLLPPTHLAEGRPAGRPPLIPSIPSCIPNNPSPTCHLYVCKGPTERPS